MTKDEIKKALECCEKYAYCKDCPCSAYCTHDLHNDALALITEQEKEIEKQGQKIENLNGLIDYADKENMKLKADKQELATALRQSEDNYSRAFERLKAQEREIGKLKEEKKQAKIDVLNNVKDVLANQKHECLERNNLVGYSAICVCEKFIDGLIKEVQNGKDKG